jgi:hypothetical protein
MIQREPLGATMAPQGLESSNLQAYMWFTIGKPVNLLSIAISDRLRRQKIVAFSTAC